LNGFKKGKPISKKNWLECIGKVLKGRKDKLPNTPSLPLSLSLFTSDKIKKNQRKIQWPTEVTTARRKARKNTCSYWPYKKINE
jgi:hypothetical protein